MIPELAHFFLIVALVLGLMLIATVIFGVRRQDNHLMLFSKSLVFSQGFCIALSFIALMLLFVQNDFTVKYVSEHSNTLLPVWYRMAAVWGGHEGSVLLWALVLSGWMCAVAKAKTVIPSNILSLVLAIMGAVLLGFLLFILFTSNPFDRILPTFPMDGADLNPLLQDIGLILHPPLLYMGYVGFSVVFAFAIAGLITGNLDAAWARWARPWTITSWSFLSVGIALGSWWAYYELGWGGWWFWDPVENASFMPWLAGTALLHSLAATEKRGVFKAWTILLAILVFSLSLLGTFLVRSGVLTSVHSFANDASRGVFILIFLGVVVGGSLALFAWRAPLFRGQAEYKIISKEAMIFLNNLALTVAVTVVLLGTLFPLVAEIMGFGKISVGPPYFNALMIPVSLFLVFLLGFAPFIKWKKDNAKVTFKKLAWILPLALVLGVLLPLFIEGSYSIKTALVIGLVLVAVIRLFSEIAKQALSYNVSFLKGFTRIHRSYLGMHSAHFGLLVTVVGVSMTSLHSIEKNVKMARGDTLVIQGYQVVFDKLETFEEKNYESRQGFFSLYQNDKFITTLKPEKRSYSVQKNLMTEAAIDGGLFRDIYVALGEPFPDGSWSVRVQVKSFIRWIWAGALFMALGGFLVVIDPRYSTKLSRAKLS